MPFSITYYYSFRPPLPLPRLACLILCVCVLLVFATLLRLLRHHFSTCFSLIPLLGVLWCLRDIIEFNFDWQIIDASKYIISIRCLQINFSNRLNLINAHGLIGLNGLFGLTAAVYELWELSVYSFIICMSETANAVARSLCAWAYNETTNNERGMSTSYSRRPLSAWMCQRSECVWLVNQLWARQSK